MDRFTITQLFDLTGKNALVTGAAKGIGQAIALRLAEAGAEIMVADIDLDSAQETVTRIESLGGKATLIRLDTSNVADARAVIENITQTGGRCDILVNNAGIFPFATALDLTEASWDQVLDVNLKGSFFLAQAVAKAMIAGGCGGSIVNIASIDGLHPTGNLAHYDASKGGLVMLTKSLAKEWGPQGIRVNAIAPGSIATPGAAAATSASMPSTSISSVGMMESFLARIPLGRTGEPDDIATAVLFLVSHAASYVTGSLLLVDGGYLLS